MSESKCGNGFDDIRDALMRPAKTDDHLDAWAEETFDRLSIQSKQQKRRELQLKTDLGELMNTFDELSNYVD